MPSKRSRKVHFGAVVALVVALAIGLLSRGSVQAPTTEPEVPPPPAIAAAEVRTWKAAAREVEEKRGEPTGMAAAVNTPSELRHYAERRRFLAVQVAETEEQDVELPHDEAALIAQIREGTLVRMPVLGDDYILYGVGASATGEPFAHWDERTGARIPLYDGWADADDAQRELAADAASKKAEAAQRRAELRRIRVTVRTRARRRHLQAQIRAADREAAALETRRRHLTAWYEDYERRRLLVSEHARVQDFARDAGGRAYDVEVPGQRRLMRARMLAYVRPEARDVILELARRYRERFGRPLPVTSLVRTEAYQLQLRRSNPNATTIDSPPHATGLAFDVHYGHMTAAEQESIMDDLRQMEAAGRLEALRETRSHFHVFVFPDGQRPSEQLIIASLDDVRPARVSRSSGGRRSRVASSRVRRAASVKKAPARRPPPRRAPAREAPAPTGPPAPSLGPHGTGPG